MGTECAEWGVARSDQDREGKTSSCWIGRQRGRLSNGGHWLLGQEQLSRGRGGHGSPCPEECVGGEAGGHGMVARARTAVSKDRSRAGEGRDLRVHSADSGDRGLKVCEESRKTQPSRKGTRVSPRAQAGVPRKQEGISARAKCRGRGRGLQLGAGGGLARRGLSQDTTNRGVRVCSWATHSCAGDLGELPNFSAPHFHCL